EDKSLQLLIKHIISFALVFTLYHNGLKAQEDISSDAQPSFPSQTPAQNPEESLLNEPPAPTEPLSQENSASEIPFNNDSLAPANSVDVATPVEPPSRPQNSREIFLVKDIPQTLTFDYDVGEIAIGNPQV